MRTVVGEIPRLSAIRRAVLPLFLVSGAAGLLYEVVWTRAFGVVFGNTIFAVSTVLTAFMLGLASGSWFFGRIADRVSLPLKLYALIELCIGVYAFLFPAILDATDIFYRWFFRAFHPGFYSLSLVRFVLSVIILIIPTGLMGGTLPVLSRLWASPVQRESPDSRVGQGVGLLYAINTLGAVVGSFVSGYLLLRTIGVHNTIYVAASANVFAGTAAFLLSRFGRGRVAAESVSPPVQASKAKKKRRGHEDASVEARQTAVSAEHERRQTIVLIAVGVAGFCALALEVLWTRVLVFVLGTTVYAFVCMLTCFLLGLALGSFLCSQLFLKRIKNLVFALGLVELLIALSAFVSIPLVGKLWHIDYALVWRLRAGSFWADILAQFIDALLILLVPTMLMGAAFPIAVKACAKSSKAVGRRVGEVYASNTVGCVFGSFAAGFVMVPLLGLRDSFLVVVVVLLILGVVVIFLSERSRARLGPLAGAFSLGIILVGYLSIPRDVFLRTMNTYHYPSKIVYIKDDATGTVTVHDLPDGDRLIAVDGVDVAGMDFMLRTTQKLQGYVPLLVHDNPKKALQIGLGSGETSGVGLGFGVEEYSIVEICPGIFDAGEFFEKINRGSYRNPKLRKIIMDGKNFVKMTNENFDVIMNDATYPGTTGSSALYTYDHFLECRDHLRPGGVLSSWLPLDLRPEDFRTIVRTFQEVMPHSSLWMANNCLNKHSVLLGSLSPLRIDFQRVKKLVERPDISADLGEINIRSVYDFLDCFVVDEGGLRTIAEGVPLNTDDKPLLEFGAAIKRDVDASFAVVLSDLVKHHSPVLPRVVNTGSTDAESREVNDRLERYFTGTSHALRGLLAMVHEDPDVLNYEFEAARKANPDDRDVQSCLDELNGEIRDLVEAVSRMPRNPSLRWRLGKRYMLLRDYNRAAEQYLSFLDLDPGIAVGWNNLGICYKEMANNSKAVEAFQKALALHPGLASAHLHLGEVYGEMRDFAASSRSYEKALALNPRSQRVYISMADTYYRLDRVEESLDILNRCLAQWPNFVPAYDKLARAYFRQKKFDMALQAIEKAVALAPTDLALQRRRDAVRQAIQGGPP